MGLWQEKLRRQRIRGPSSSNMLDGADVVVGEGVRRLSSSVLNVGSSVLNVGKAGGCAFYGYDLGVLFIHW